MFSEEEVTSRWKDEYRRELKKVLLPCSGDGPNNYKPSWTYFEMMGFLKDVMTPAVKSGNLSTCHQSEDKIDVEIEDDDTRDTDIENPPSTSITSNVSEKQPPSISASSTTSQQEREKEYPMQGTKSIWK
ncbi:unnamed protein product [Brassicogethes aeneus]|uniref:MADF domain-containing protein n=1 Tax=Brassicogethes aeneus TaxID=1431903 RepID=A0A9P0BGP3_BRAAE|nr:unnamed protein product [Brassicogethes aeneus]